MKESAITEEIRGLIGREAPSYTRRVEKGFIDLFLEVTEDDNPLYYDEQYARQTKYKTVVAPPTFFCPDANVIGQNTGLRFPQVFKYDIDGGHIYDFFLRVREGDTLTITPKIADIYEKQGSERTGHMIFAVVEASCRNQRGELVGVTRTIWINHQGPAAERDS